MYRLLHLVAFETRDRVIWETLDALARERGGQTGELLGMAATAVLSQEALGAHMQDRNEERIAWAHGAMEYELAVRLEHSADERVPVDDLELGVTALRHAALTVL